MKTSITATDEKRPTAAMLVAERKFTKWRTFRIGDFEEIQTIFLSPVDLGCPVRHEMQWEFVATYAELLNPARLARWSKENVKHLPDGYAVELLPTETGLHIRDQYGMEDQPPGETLYIATKKIGFFRDVPSLFAISRDRGGVLSGICSWMLCRPDTRLLFCLREVA